MSWIFYCLLLYRVTNGNVRINGEISFDLQISDTDDKMLRSDDSVQTRGNRSEARSPLRTRMRNVTAAPPAECVYQYPEKEQVNAVLSNMMNQLAKIFVRANEYVRKRHSRRDEQQQVRRFTIVDKANNTWFDIIYNNMTTEYKQYYNNTWKGMQRSGDDPCQHQDEIKQMWRTFLDSSAARLKRAARTCVDNSLRAHSTPAGGTTRNTLKHFLMKELGKIRSQQLDTLCDHFQLCYNELL